MSRSDRLLELIQFLRTRRRPVAGAQLADEFGVSLRTIYRDIQTLIARGAPIDGEAGVGYVLRPGFTVPPLMFSREEIEALALGSQMVARSADAALTKAARNALAKITAVLPAERSDEANASGVLAGPVRWIGAEIVDMAPVRDAIRQESKLWIHYRDEAGVLTERRIWPILLTFCATVRLLAAWCELREGYRQFRTDRIVAFTETGEAYPRRRHALVKEWREIEGLPEPA
ncbi:YafY family transcriptional regulator [Bradyrhizobium huanghuaihaiense]|uniref:helix-turn-helix transcriptional regulator n=1 Tax=Bradyrhizobium huanghuaihaiense TaxID=990078 RepID=UPI0021AB0121|nr:YafY family protein [Bradyrhizobium sp. CB3035]UWU74648.1 YafY family transcriptional regulator [Bradyrhizobium sp. CB3035]